MMDKIALYRYIGEVAQRIKTADTVSPLTAGLVTLGLLGATGVGIPYLQSRWTGSAVAKALKKQREEEGIKPYLPWIGAGLAAGALGHHLYSHNRDRRRRD